MKMLQHMLSTSLVLSASAFVPLSVRAANRNAAASTVRGLHLFDKLFGSGSGSSPADATTGASQASYPVLAADSIMSPKAHGTSAQPVQTRLRWNCDYATADRICNFNRHYAEHAGYWTTTDFVKAVKDGREAAPVQFYDSVTGALLFTAPVGRTTQEFLDESAKHGWPSFRDEETNWEHVRVLKNGECVSVTGTHLGHNLPDRSGNRYCINLVSVAGQPATE
jgi:hypothetical protein